MKNTSARVTVKKINAKRYELFAPGLNIPFAVSTTQRKARGTAYTYARYKLGNQSMFEKCCIEPVGWAL